MVLPWLAHSKAQVVTQFVRLSVPHIEAVYLYVMRGSWCGVRERRRRRRRRRRRCRRLVPPCYLRSSSSSRR